MNNDIDEIYVPQSEKEKQILEKLNNVKKMREGPYRYVLVLTCGEELECFSELSIGNIINCHFNNEILAIQELKNGMVIPYTTYIEKSKVSRIRIPKN